MGMRSSINSRGANSAGTAILQKAFAATSKANLQLLLQLLLQLHAWLHQKPFGQAHPWLEAV